MRRIRFDPATYPGIDAVKWARWAARAEAATKAVRDWFDVRVSPAPAPPVLLPSIWADLKDLILESVFRGRCSFCEVDESVGGFGDAEHYRPKRPVEALDTEGKRKPIRVGDEEHPGYAWLAYDWQNIIPACSKCNTYKANVHCARPVQGHMTTVELNAHEQPLLLHPYFDDPGEHLVFGERGIVAARQNSPRGRAMIDVAGAYATVLPADSTIPLGGKEEEEEEKREELENESEKNHFAERAERAREQTEKDSEAQKSSQMAEDRSATAVVRAQLEVISTRGAPSGTPTDPDVLISDL